MKYSKRLSRLELNQKSIVNLHLLDNADLHAFSRLVQKSGGLQNHDALSDSELERLADLLAALRARSAKAQQTYDAALRLPDSQFDEFVDDFNQTRRAFDWTAEIEREHLRRANLYR